jgi:hypothetical protein
MPTHTPINGPHEFSGRQTTDIGQIQANAAAFIAERVAGIEWQLVELNNNLFKILSVLQPPNVKIP